MLVLINEVNPRWAGLVLGWLTSSGFNHRCETFILVCNQPPRSTQPGHPFVGRHNEYQSIGSLESSTWDFLFVFIELSSRLTDGRTDSYLMAILCIALHAVSHSKKLHSVHSRTCGDHIILLRVTKTTSRKLLTIKKKLFMSLQTFPG